MARPTKQVYRDLPVRTLSDWSVDAVKAALNELEYGCFTRAALLADAMTRDDRIAAVLDTRVLGVLALPMSLEPGEGPQAEAALEEVQTSYLKMFPEKATAEALRCGLMLGVVVGELVWDLGDRWLPRLKVWHPSFLEYRWEERRFYVYTQDGAVPVTPGDGKWIVLTPGGDQRPWMGGLIRRLAIPYLIRNFAMRDWARYSEVHGLPIRKAKVPSGAKQEDKDTFLSQVADLGNESVVLVPFDEQAQGDGKGFDLLLEEAKGDSWEGFERLMAKMESSIAITVLGQNLTTEVTGGSHAAANVHDRVRQDYIEADAGLLETEIREQVLTWWAEFNLGNREAAPWPKWETTPPPEDGKIYQYHLDYQVVTLDEARARIGLGPAAEGGDKPPVPIAQPGTAPTPGKETLSRRVFLASGEDPGQARGFVQGQLYTDDLGDDARARGATVVRPDLRAVLRLIESAESYDQLREGLVTLYGKMERGELASLMEKALVLAELAGRHAVLEDL